MTKKPLTLPMTHLLQVHLKAHLLEIRKPPQQPCQSPHHLLQYLLHRHHDPRRHHSLHPLPQTPPIPGSRRQLLPVLIVASPR